MSTDMTDQSTTDAMRRAQRTAALRRGMAGGISALALCISAGQALAQSTTVQTPPAAPESDQASQIEDIVVTAQRRSENLQDVPITVAAVTEQMLENRGLRTNEDLNTSIPNLNIARASGPMTPFLRGIGNNSTNPGQEQNVAIYIDGVYYASMSADVASFNNVERIEVLKGPQGTLFGRNTTGGLLQIITKDPSHEFSGKATIGYGNYQTARGGFYVTGGLTDTLAADLSVNGQNQNQGWGHNVVTGDRVHYRNDINVRSKLLWEPSDLTRVVLSADYSKTSDDVGSGRMVLPELPPLPAAFLNYDSNGNIYDVSGNSSKRDRTTTSGVSLNVRHDFQNFSVVNIAAYRDLQRHSALDLENTPATRSFADPYDEGTKTFSNELQILSPAGAPFSWIVGAYYFYADAQANPIKLNIAALGAAQYQLIEDSSVTNSYSVFGQAVFPLWSDKTHLTTGIRYTTDDKSIEGSLRTALALVYEGKQENSWSEPTWRVALDHQLTDNVMIFGSVSTGFKSGVFNATSPSQGAVNPETITAYEIGMKSDLFDKRLRFNGATYYYDYQDIQVSKFTGTGIEQQNAAAAKIYGIEFDVDGYLTDHLRINGGFAAQHSEFTSFPGAVSFVRGANGLGIQTVIDASGNSLPRAPDMTWNIGFEYVWPVDVGELALNANFYHNDGFAWDADNRLNQKPYELLNGSVAWTSPDEAYKVRLWAANLLDEEYYVYVSSGNGNPDAGSPGAPRTFGIALDYNF
jgi:iron complex outermembrane receptor protein